MPHQALFEGLVVDEFDQAVTTTHIGDEPFYVVDDAGFKRHIPSSDVDRQVLKIMQQKIEGSEGAISEQAARMLGQDDPFSKAMIENQLKNIDQQFEALLNTGLAEEARAYLGMAGFKIRINLHGEVMEVIQPGAIDPDEGE